MGGPNVVMGAQLMCSMGVAPSALIVTPEKRVLVEGKPAANRVDSVPMKNIMPFGMCQSLSNPTVASATAAALGVLTPMPCVPNTPAPWNPGAAKTKVGPLNALTADCTTDCSWGGKITIINPGATKTISN